MCIPSMLSNRLIILPTEDEPEQPSEKTNNGAAGDLASREEIKRATSIRSKQKMRSFNMCARLPAPPPAD